MDARETREMDRAYWDEVAADYDAAIYSVRDHDEAGLVEAHIRQLANPEHVAADLGCGVGKYTGLLAGHFDRVHACDLSPKLLAAARRTCREHDNIDFFETDLGRVPHPFEPVDFVLCVNVLIMADLDARMSAWRAVTAQVKRGGHLLLVTPATESAHYTQFRRIDWCLRVGLDCVSTLRESVPDKGSVSDLYQGIYPLEGMRTKHHLREELLVLLGEHQFEVQTVEKLAYPWTMEFSDPPDWLQDPQPWDWLVVARRR